jgi:hypothetical protein
MQTSAQNDIYWTRLKSCSAKQKQDQTSTIQKLNYFPNFERPYKIVLGTNCLKNVD